MSRSFFHRLINFIKARYAPRGAQHSFSGAGEDLIIADIFKKFGIKKPKYIDVGAHHPVFGNNTYYFYGNGGRGVLVEPNASMCEKIRTKRPKDICISAGVGGADGEADFYSFMRDTRSTFSPVEAGAWEELSGDKPSVSKKEIVSLNTLISKHLDGGCPDLISIDTEGYEVEILSRFSWSCRPKVFCIEMTSSSGGENSEVYEIMKAHGYSLVGRTLVNAIFVDMP